MTDKKEENGMAQADDAVCAAKGHNKGLGNHFHWCGAYYEEEICNRCGQKWFTKNSQSISRSEFEKAWNEMEDYWNH